MLTREFASRRLVLLGVMMSLSVALLAGCGGGTGQSPAKAPVADRDKILQSATGESQAADDAGATSVDPADNVNVRRRGAAALREQAPPSENP